MKLALALCAAFLLVVLVQAEQECTPGQTKKQDCNTCNCTPTGVWACTRKGCPPHKREISCEPGTTFKDKCNTCRCGSDGKSAACTLKACPHQ
ncbi:serine protease inhibitor I/II [Schistocerca serialis cubense]|uniref:serine protease inhibitor I/II n=1 Tax=Schistocerca serialis cubense TaxID=2023355 RepID=UPI00214EB9EA|nr:serine protease inhibitor I/II [Schistocerca serialis cubense]